MAIEDGATLATLLPTDALANEIPNRLEWYEEIRKGVGIVRQTAQTIAKGLSIDKCWRSIIDFRKTILLWSMPKEPCRNT